MAQSTDIWRFSVVLDAYLMLVLDAVEEVNLRRAARAPLSTA